MDLSNPIRNLYNSVPHPSHEDVTKLPVPQQGLSGLESALIKILVVPLAVFFFSILAGFDHSVKAKLK